MRLNPDSLTVESFPTESVPEQVGAASSDTGVLDCSSYCRRPTCRYEVCG